jgi:hypothetical protein
VPKPELLRISLNGHSEADEAAGNDGAADFDQSFGQNTKSESNSSSTADFNGGIELEIFSLLLIFVEDGVDTFRCLVHPDNRISKIRSGIFCEGTAPGILLAQIFMRTLKKM